MVVMASSKLGWLAVKGETYKPVAVRMEEMKFLGAVAARENLEILIDHPRTILGGPCR